MQRKEIQTQRSSRFFHPWQVLSGLFFLGPEDDLEGSFVKFFKHSSRIELYSVSPDSSFN
jgi:hypothetical protein